MQLIYYPAPILLQQCQPVLNSGKGQRRKDRLELANAMWNIMHKNHGIGLSIPQVGRGHRMFVWNHMGNQIYNQAIPGNPFYVMALIPHKQIEITTK